MAAEVRVKSRWEGANRQMSCRPLPILPLIQKAWEGRGRGQAPLSWSTPPPDLQLSPNATALVGRFASRLFPQALTGNALTPLPRSQLFLYPQHPLIDRMAKRGFSHVKEGPAQQQEPAGAEDCAADLFASKMLLSLASTPVVHSPSSEQMADDAACAVSVSTTRSGRPESTRSGAESTKCFESGDDDMGGEDDDDDEDDGMESRSSSPLSLDEEGERKRSRGLLRTAKSITLDELRHYFDKPIEEAAKTIGICSTLLKKICRKYNIKRWPYRQIKSLDRTIDCLRIAAQNARPAEQERFNNQIRLLESRRTELIESSTLPGHKRAAASNELAGAELMADITSLQRRAVSLGKPLQHRSRPSSESQAATNNSTTTTGGSGSSSSSSPDGGGSSTTHPASSMDVVAVNNNNNNNNNTTTTNENNPPNTTTTNNNNNHTTTNKGWLMQPVHPHLPTAFGIMQPHAPKPLVLPTPPPPAAAAAPPPPLATPLPFMPLPPIGMPTPPPHPFMFAAGFNDQQQQQQQHQQQALFMHKLAASHMMAMPNPHLFPFLGFMAGGAPPPPPILPAAMGPAALMAADPAHFARTMAFLRDHQQRMAAAATSAASAATTTTTTTTSSPSSTPPSM